MNGGALIVAFMEKQGIDRLFCVPGESFLPILDALQDSFIQTVVARHEGGAAMMAEADAKLTSRPGVVLVTRGPGASNAASGIHIAQQDSTPLIMLVGQVARSMRGRDAFQEIDYEAMFGGMAKYVEEIHEGARLPLALAEAFKQSMQGRPGPVVLSLPEDMLYDQLTAPDLPKIEVKHPAPKAEAIKEARGMLARAKKPMVIVGGSLWCQESRHKLAAWAARHRLPVACSFRRQRLMDSTSPYYAGDLGLGCNPRLIKRIQAADLLILLGGRLSEIASQSYTLVNIPKPHMPLMHIHSDDHELGRVYHPDLGLCTTPLGFLDAMLEGESESDSDSESGSGSDSGSASAAPLPEHDAYLDWSKPQPPAPSPPRADSVDMARLVKHLRDTLPHEAIITNGAGNYATWLHRYYHYRDFYAQLAPTSGTMGYGLPAAIAAKARFPERPVLAFAGDGCLQMTLQELATAKQIGANIITLVIDNGLYGTIRMHQERTFPGRIEHTGLLNPDFCRLGESMGFHTEKVTTTEAFPEALRRCMGANQPSLIHIITDPEAITPNTTLSALRAAAQDKHAQSS